MINKSPNYFAFFDVDGTLLSIKTMLSFLRFYYRARFGKLLGELAFKFYMLKIKYYEKTGRGREFLNKRYYENFKGENQNILREYSRAWFEAESKNNEGLYHINVIEELYKHKAKKAEIVLVSGSFDMCLLPIAKKLGVKAFLAADLETLNENYTGRLIGIQTIGEGKAQAVKAFLSKKGYQTYEQCFAYGDHISDLPMLELVGNPSVIAGDKDLERAAKERKWQIIQPVLGKFN